MAMAATKAETKGKKVRNKKGKGWKQKPLTMTSEPANLTSIITAMMLIGTQTMPPESLTPAYGSRYLSRMLQKDSERRSDVLRGQHGVDGGVDEEHGCSPPRHVSAQPRRECFLHPNDKAAVPWKRCR